MSTTNAQPLSRFAPLAAIPEVSAENPSNVGQNRTFGDIDPNFNLSNAQCRAIELALDGTRWSQIARTMGLSPKTLWRWKTQNPDFQLALADARADRRDFAVERCQTLASRAAHVLGKYLDDSTEDKHRLRAAQILLQSAARFAPREPRRPRVTYPPNPLLTPPPPGEFPPDPFIAPDLDDPEPELEPKVG